MTRYLEAPARHVEYTRRPYARPERPTTRTERAAILVDPRNLDRYSDEDAMWSESEQERREALLRSACRDMLLTWAWAHLARLSPEQRKCIELRAFRGMTYERAGQCLGRTASTVKRNESRGLAKLRALRPEAGALPVYSEIYRFGPHKRALARLRAEARRAFYS